jgi:hypothetical protein
MAKPSQGRFDGLSGMRKFAAEELAAWARQHEAQVSALENSDDPKWLQRRADRLRRVATAKEKAREQKRRERRR